MTRKRLLRIGICGTPAVLLLVVLHPHIWQSMFGPKIRGVPLWAWQQSLRRSIAADNGTDSLLQKTLRWAESKWLKPEPWPRFEPDMVPVLLSMVDDPSPDVRANVAFQLGANPLSPESAEALVRLLDDPVDRVRGHAAQSLALAASPYEPALPRLRVRLADTDMLCRHMSAVAVCRTGKALDAQAFSVLRDALHSGNAYTRLDATAALCHLGKAFPEVLPEVAAAARKYEDGCLGLARAAKYAGAAGVPFLVELLDHRDQMVRMEAANSLGNLGPQAKEAIPALTRHRTHSDPLFSAAVGFAMHRITPQQGN
jgi:HEAT repeat protein